MLLSQTQISDSGKCNEFRQRIADDDHYTNVNDDYSPDQCTRSSRSVLQDGLISFTPY